MSTTTSIEIGISVGSCLSMILSWYINKSIAWCLVHGFFSWIYVIYFAITQEY